MPVGAPPAGRRPPPADYIPKCKSLPPLFSGGDLSPPRLIQWLERWPEVGFLGMTSIPPLL